MTNARSLSPKIESLQNVFTEHEVDVAFITESWLKDGQVLDRDVIDLEYGTDLKIIYKKRPKKATARSVGGGVSIVYRKSKCSMRERKVLGNKFELVVAVGRIGRLPRPAAFMCVYIQPTMKVAEWAELQELVVDEVLKLKAKGDPLIFIGGDMNRRCLNDCLSIFPDMKQCNHAPTRGIACLDVLYSNALYTNEAVWPPLHTLEGVPSDHSVVIVSGAEPKQRDFTWVKKTTRKHTRKAVEQFGREVGGISWTELLPGTMSTDELIDTFQSKMGEITDRLFPLKTVRYRSNDPPWVTDGIRKLSKQKMRVFRGEGKTPFWTRLRDRMIALTEASRENFANNLDKADVRKYFAAVKKLGKPAQAAEWAVNDLFPGRTPEEAGNEAAKFFTKITDQFIPIDPPRVPTLNPRQPIDVREVAKLLRESKKPNSSVPGDVMPRLMKKYHALFAVPATILFNSIFASGQWPQRWKEETTVVIPKMGCPESMADCRNISCTPFLSKVLESIILGDLRANIPEDPAQYGGIKGSSANHLLVELFDKALGGLDEGKAAVILGIDYQKAFNQLDHRECVKQLQLLGAAQHSIDLVTSFLSGRSMRVKVGSTLSDPRPLSGGSPQGSILGGYLYCATTQQIDTTPLERRGIVRPPTTTATPAAAPSPGSITSEDGMGLLPATPPSSGIEDGDVTGTLSDLSFRTAGSPETPSPELLMPDQAPHGNNNTIMLKYIDDTTTVTTIPMQAAVRHIGPAKPSELIWAEEVEAIFRGIIWKAEEIGMIVNCKKTQLLCISTDNGYNTTASINIDGEEVGSMENMKLLGFMVSANSSMAAQVAMIKGKFRARFWTLIHLKRSGITGLSLFRLYSALVRPVLEANSVVFHSMLTKQQSGELERLQKHALKLCFGFDKHYQQILEQHNLTTLEQRRVKAICKFTAAAMKNPRYANKWFKRRNEVDQDIRNRRPFVEKRARTERYKSSPLLFIQKTANDICTNATEIN